MTQEEKELVLKDLCARLPHWVKVDVNFYYATKELSCDLIQDLLLDEKSLRPYLRPMSSMTEEEREELSDYLCEQIMSNKIGITIPPNPTQGKGIPFIWMGDCLDWLNAHYFDYRGLIEKGLALEAPEGMYK